jgi:hypothetical protein
MLVQLYWIYSETIAPRKSNFEGMSHCGQPAAAEPFHPTTTMPDFYQRSIPFPFGLPWTMVRRARCSPQRRSNASATGFAQNGPSQKSLFRSHILIAFLTSSRLQNHSPVVYKTGTETAQRFTVKVLTFDSGTRLPRKCVLRITLSPPIASTRRHIHVIASVHCIQPYSTAPLTCPSAEIITKRVVKGSKSGHLLIRQRTRQFEGL